MVETLKNRIGRDFEPAIRISRLPAFYCWAAFVLGLGCAYMLPLRQPSQLYHFPAATAIIVVLVFLTILLTGYFKLITAFLAGLLLLSLHTETEGRFFALVPPDTNQALLYGNTASHDFRTPSGYLLHIRVDSVLFSAGEKMPFKGKKVVCRSRDRIPARSQIVLKGDFYPPRARMNPNGFDEYNHLLSRGMYGRFYSDEIMRSRPMDKPPVTFLVSRTRTYVADRIATFASPRHRATLAAAVLADRHCLPTFIRESYRNAGIIHLLAISGLHVGIVATFSFFLIYLFPVPPPLRALAVMVIVCGYLLLVGPAPSIFRATVMTCIILAGTAFYRKSRILNVIGLAGLLWLLISPRSLFTPGYQLSFAATLGIVLLYPIFSSILPPPTGTLSRTLVLRKVAGLFLVSLAGFFATAPVLMYHFREISLLGLITNLWAVSSMTAAMFSFFAGLLLSFFSDTLAQPMYLLTRFFLSLIATTADYVRLIPGGSIRTAVPSVIVLISFTLTLVIPALATPKRRLCYGIPLILVTLIAYPTMATHSLGSKQPEVCLFSLRKGDAAGIRLLGNRSWLVLSSRETMYNKPARDALLPWLQKFPRCRLDGIVVPRASNNLIHDLDPLFREYRVKRVVTGALPRDPGFLEDLDSYLAEHGATHEEMVNGGTIHLSDSEKIEIYRPCVSSTKKGAEAPDPHWSVVFNGIRVSYPCSVIGENRGEVVLQDGIAKPSGDFGFPDEFSLAGPIDLSELGALTLKPSHIECIEWFLETKRGRSFRGCPGKQPPK